MTTLAGLPGNAAQQAGEPPLNRAADALLAEDQAIAVDLDSVDELSRDVAASALAHAIRSAGPFLTLVERLVLAAALVPEYHEHPGGQVGDLP